MDARVKMVVAYHGGVFRGAAANPGVRTVVGDLVVAIERVIRQPVELTLAGRTDAGVHAWGQVISADVPSSTDLGSLQLRLNKLCRPAIAVREIEWVDSEFNARFSATWRRYRYHVWNHRAPNPLMADTAWHVPQELDLAAMASACGHLVGEHDFSSFCRAPKQVERRVSLVRIMNSMTWLRVDDSPLLRFEVQGSAFCHQQVRSMVGTTVDVGIGRRSAEEIPAVLTARDRNAAGQVAPPHGLVLWEVGYQGPRWSESSESGGIAP